MVVNSLYSLSDLYTTVRTGIHNRTRHRVLTGILGFSGRNMVNHDVLNRQIGKYTTVHNKAINRNTLHDEVRRQHQKLG
jgi:hypothetical protein